MFDVRPRSPLFVAILLTAVFACVGVRCSFAQSAASPTASPDAPQEALTTYSMAVSLQAGTNGVGAALHLPLQSRVHVRATFTDVAVSHGQMVQQNDLDVFAQGTLRLGGLGLWAEWYPTGRVFHVSGGVLIGGPRLDAWIRPTSAYAYSPTRSFEPEKLGSLQMTAKYAPVSPYVGIGWGNAFRGDWSFMVDLGMHYLSPPRISMRGKGLIAPTAQQAGQLEQHFRSFRYLPYVGIGLSRRF